MFPSWLHNLQHVLRYGVNDINLYSAYIKTSYKLAGNAIRWICLFKATTTHHEVRHFEQEVYPAYNSPVWDSLLLPSLPFWLSAFPRKALDGDYHNVWAREKRFMFWMWHLDLPVWTILLYILFHEFACDIGVWPWHSIMACLLAVYCFIFWWNVLICLWLWWGQYVRLNTDM